MGIYILWIIGGNYMFGWLDYLVTLIVENLFNIPITTSLGSSIHFFIYDSIKIIILLGSMIFAISYLRSYFPPEKTKKILEKFGGIKGNIMASLLGIVTPFCSCSSVPLFIGFIEAGIPLGVTFSFLITSPMVNEAAIAILFGDLGWQIGTMYIITGVAVGVIGGRIIDRLKMTNQVEEYVYQIKSRDIELTELSHKERFKTAIENVVDIIKRVWIFLIIGIAIGAVIHGWAPEDIYQNMLVRIIQ